MRFSWAVTVALLLLLPVLAVLQYRWIGKVSDAERDQLQASVRAAAEQFAQDFTSTMLSALREGTPPVRDIYRIEAGEPRGVGLERWNRSTHAFAAVEWPADLEALQARFASPKEPTDRPDGVVEDADPSLLFLPRFGPGGDGFGAGGRGRGPGRIGPDTIGPDPDGRGPEPGFRRPGPVPRDGDQDPNFRPSGRRFDLPRITFAQLDLNYVRNTMVPQLASKYFPKTQDYRLLLVQSRTQRVIYPASGTASVEDGAPSDVTVPILGPPQLHDLGGKQAPSEEAHGPWELWVTARSGALDAAIADARRRNLTLSFAALALLGSAMLLLTASARRAQVLAKRQMEFVAGVSHELRTPLSVIRAAGENLSAGVASSETQVKRYGAMIEQEGRRLTGMVETLLDFGALESGRMALESAAVDVAKLIAEAVASCEGERQETGCTVEQTVAPDLPIVDADAQALFLCVRNLLSNALRYGASGKHVEISASAKDDDALIIVTDRGPGISAEDLPHLFEPFYRGSEGKASQTRGAGVGLSLVRQLIRAQRGDYYGGEYAGDGRALHSSHSHVARGWRKIMSGPRILLVEDEPGLVLTLTDRLENEGYGVECSTDGKPAWTWRRAGASTCCCWTSCCRARAGSTCAASCARTAWTRPS